MNKSVKKTKTSTLPHYHVTAGLIRNNGKILITQRRSGDLFAGLWEFPGGKLQPGETLEQCLTREIAEELDFPIRVEQKLMQVVHQYETLRITLHVFWCTPLHDQPTCHAVAAWRWVGIDEFDRYQFTEADQQVVAKLKALSVNHYFE